MARIIYKLNDHWNELEVDEVLVLGGQLTHQSLRALHPHQEALLKMSKDNDIKKLTLRDMAALAGIPVSPQLVKHHLEQLKKKGLLTNPSVKEQQCNQ